MAEEQQTVLGLQKESKLECKSCNIKFKNLRCAYEHYLKAHDGTAKGIFMKDKCKVTICEDRNIFYPLDPNDGIVCGYCMKGSNCGKFLSISGFVSHMENNCSINVPITDREEHQKKWREANKRKGGKKEVKPAKRQKIKSSPSLAELTSESESEISALSSKINGTSEKGGDEQKKRGRRAEKAEIEKEKINSSPSLTRRSKRKGLGREKAEKEKAEKEKKMAAFNSWCNEKEVESVSCLLKDLNIGDEFIKKFIIDGCPEWFWGRVTKRNQVQYGDGEIGQKGGPEGLGKGTVWFKYHGDYTNEIEGYFK